MNRRSRWTGLVSVGTVMLQICISPHFGRAAEAFDRTGTQWAPFIEWELTNDTYEGNPYEVEASATFVHAQSGEKHTTPMFYDGNHTWKFRFTGTQPGQWKMVTASRDPDLDGRRGVVTIEPNPDGYGFVGHVGNKWARQRGAGGELEVFVPQYVMYDGPHRFYGRPAKIAADIETFIVEHGFTGFTFPVLCRWFDLDQDQATGIKEADPNPDRRTFEALELLITKVHAAGGVVHLWMWGDEQRRMTPAKWGINGPADRRLQRYIAARLGPLPGWTASYGIDLHEWVSGDHIAEWRNSLQSQMGWPHMLGARTGGGVRDKKSGKPVSILTQLTEAMDYASYQQYLPDYEHYVKAISERPTRPAFSEDRFRVREGEKWAWKDYTYEMTRRGLWHSMMAGGVANIWGNLDGNFDANFGEGGSARYPQPHWIKTYACFMRGRFLADFIRDNTLTDGVCLKTPAGAHFLFYQESTQMIEMDLSGMARPQPAVAVDTAKPYAEIDLGVLQPKRHEWTAPYATDWAIAVGDFRGGEGPRSHVDPTDLSAAPAATPDSRPGDRHPDLQCVYPADVFLHAGKGGRVIDVTGAPSPSSPSASPTSTTPWPTTPFATSRSTPAAGTRRPFHVIKAAFVRRNSAATDASRRAERHERTSLSGQDRDSVPA